MRTRHRLLDAEEDALLDDVGACPTPQHIKVARYEDEMLAEAIRQRRSGEPLRARCLAVPMAAFYASRE